MTTTAGRGVDPAAAAVPPATVDLVLREATVLTLDDQDSCFTGDVAVDNGVIVALGPSLPWVGREELLLRDHVVMPGFVNAHTHECMERGWFEDLAFSEWLHGHALPKDRAYTAEHQHAAAGLVQLELMMSGFTSFIDTFRFPAQAAEVARRSGLRATFAPQLIEEPTGVGESLESTLAFLADTGSAPHPTIRAWVGPHALYSCSDGTFVAVAEAARAVDSGITTHLAESRDEVALIHERSGLTPAAYLDRLIGLGPDVVLAHAVELTTADIALLAQRGAAVAHCPTSNLKLGNRVAPVPDLLAAGVTVGLGTDSVMTNNILDPFAEMRMAALVAKHRSGDTRVLPAATVLRMAVGGSASALGLGAQVGRVATGWTADLIGIRLDAPHLWPWLESDTHAGNVVEQLVYAARASDVSMSMVDGRILMSDRRVRTLDVAAIRREVDVQARDLARRAGLSTGVLGRHAKRLPLSPGYEPSRPLDPR